MKATTSADQFSTEIAGLPASVPSRLVELADGQLFEMSIEPVAKQIGEHTVRMLGYNGRFPVRRCACRGRRDSVKVENRGDLEATVHWHGLRLDNATTGPTRPRSRWPIGESFTYRVQFPDPAPTGTTRTFARTTARSWASTGT